MSFHSEGPLLYSPVIRRLMPISLQEENGCLTPSKCLIPSSCLLFMNTKDRAYW